MKNKNLTIENFGLTAELNTEECATINGGDNISQRLFWAIGYIQTSISNWVNDPKRAALDGAD